MGQGSSTGNKVGVSCGAATLVGTLEALSLIVSLAKFKGQAEALGVV